MVRHLQIINNNLTATMLGDMKLRNGLCCSRLYMTSFIGVDLNFCHLSFTYFHPQCTRMFPREKRFLGTWKNMEFV